MDAVLGRYRALRDLLGGADPCAGLCRMIREVINSKIHEIPPDARIGIRAGGYHTQYLLEQFDFSHKNIVGIFDKQEKGERLWGIPCYGVDEIDKVKCDYMIISTYFLRKEILKELDFFEGEVIDFYAELEQRGLLLCAPFHHYVEDGHMALNYFYQDYLKNKESQNSEASLIRALQAAVENKDFVMVKKLCLENGGANAKNSLIREVWQKTEDLLQTIGKCVRERPQNDIILYWTDAVPYESFLRFFPKMREKSGQGCFFQRAYTNTPYTHPTMRAILSKLMPIDDFEKTQSEMNSDNSIMLQYLQHKGYEVKIFTYATSALNQDYVVENDPLTSCNVKWWNALCGMLNSEKPVFYILHFMSESHAPIISPNLRSVSYDAFSLSAAQQATVAYHYLDQCLYMYSELLSSKIQIFFSDHGDHISSEHKWAERNLHPYCFVIGEKILSQTVLKFFPYTNFYEFVQWVLEPDQRTLEDVCADEVRFQDVDVYNPMRVNNFIQRGIIREALSYRGILNDKYKYVINSLGEEFFYIRGEDGTEKLAKLENEALRAELQLKCGTNFLDVNKLEKFKYSRKLYELLVQK